MSTGDAWDVTTDPKRPVADFDPSGNRFIPLEFEDWLTKLGTTYGSHEVLLADPLELITKGTHADGVARMRVKLKTGAAYVLNQQYPMTVRLVGADGQVDDETLWLRIVEG